MSVVYKINIILFVLLLSINAFSQQDNEKIITNQVWVDYYQHTYFKLKWEYYGDAGYRFLANDFSWHMIHFRPSIRYIASDFWEALGGIGFFQTFNKDNTNTFEIRPWQGARIKWPSYKSFLFSHFIRLEERIILPKGYAAEFNMRFRYRLNLNINIYKSNKDDLLFIPIYAEWFLDAGQKIHEIFSNRSRYAIGLGYRIPKDWIFEFYFVRQNSKLMDDEEFGTVDHLYQFKIRRNLFKIESREQEKH